MKNIDSNRELQKQIKNNQRKRKSVKNLNENKYTKKSKIQMKKFIDLKKKSKNAIIANKITINKIVKKMKKFKKYQKAKMIDKKNLMKKIKSDIMLKQYVYINMCLYLF